MVQDNAVKNFFADHVGYVGYKNCPTPVVARLVGNTNDCDGAHIIPAVDRLIS